MTKIFVMTHKKFAEPENPVYVPLQVGRAVHEDLGYMGDDTGDSISEYNCYYGELTGLYWLWKNYTGQENIGLCHYRRFFVDDDMELLTEKDYDTLLQSYDIITSKAMYAGEPYYDYYGKAHNSKDLDLEGEVIKELYPEDYPVFCKVMQGEKHYFGNLMVTSRIYFNAYCEWLFSIFFELEKRIDVESYDEYHRRVFGFLSEQLLLVWITARGLKVYESRVGISEEKAETKELKLAVGQLLKSGRIEEASELFYGVLKVRPDIQLEHSDLKQEIPVIEQIIYICKMEKDRHQKGTLDDTQELPQLIIHFRHIAELLKKKEEWNDIDIKYLKEHFVTETAVEVIARNDSALQQDWRAVVDYFCSRMGEM